MFYQPVAYKEIPLLCNAYPRFYYPKGFGFYSSHVNHILYEVRSGKMTEKRMYELLHAPTFIQHVSDVLTSFTCTKENVRTWVRDDMEQGSSRFDWLDEEEETKHMSLEEKINKIIACDDEFSWWNAIGTGMYEEKRLEFETNIISAMANTIINAALSLYVAGEKKDKPFYVAIRQFISDVESEYEVRWMKELKRFTQE